MRATFALAMIPLPVFGFGWILQPAPPLIAKPVIAETVRAVRMDHDTFRLRWHPVADMPPMRETITEPLLLVAEAPPAKRISRRVALRSDVCTRHKMRRVNYGRTWRCRR